MLLNAATIAALPGEAKTHFLNAQAKRINKSLGDATGLQNLGVHWISVQPGDYSTEHHLHHFEEECIYVLSGQGLYQLTQSADGHSQAQQHVIGPGDFIACPINGSAHSLQATGSQALVCLVIGQRLSQDVSDYPQQGLRLYRNKGQWDLVEHRAITPVPR